MSDGVEQLDRRRCRDRICNAEILWAKREDSGKPVALNPEPTDEGNLILVEGHGVKPVVRQLRGYQLVEAATQPRYKAHFATCPAAERFRKRNTNRKEERR